MALRLHLPAFALPLPSPSLPSNLSNGLTSWVPKKRRPCSSRFKKTPLQHRPLVVSASALPPLDLTEDNVRQVLFDARSEFAQIFDASVGITGEVDLAELDGPFVKLSLRGRFWHERAMVLARLATYLKTRIPEILEVDIEDEKQLDDSPENF